jgi:tetratricopeptide (TPR) repeat protein
MPCQTVCIAADSGNSGGKRERFNFRQSFQQLHPSSQIVHTWSRYMKSSFFASTLLRGGLALFSALAISGNASADDLQDVKALLQEGKLTEALVKTNKLMEKRATDPSLQFVKGLILSEQKKTSEAIEIFSRLTTEHPNYPEPYNNLAVLFATEGQYTKARVALETALKLNPRYTTAQENLGDVFLQSALQAYSEAARADGDSKGLKAKLRGVRNTLGLPAADTVAAARAPTAAGPVVAAASSGATGSVGKSGAAATPESGKEKQAERELVLRVVDQWVKAWSTKDTKAYFSLYSSDFRTPHGESRETWEKNRRLRINNKSQIDIQVLSPSVTVEDRTAIVNFQQVYVAGKISSNARKSLTLKNEAGSWKILQEKSDG